MMAAVTDALGDLTAIHETFLNFSGTAKAGAETGQIHHRRDGRGAVRLTPMAARLGVAEGIATAPSAAELHRVLTWAVLSTSGMTAFMVPPSVRSVVISRRPRRAKGERQAAWHGRRGRFGATVWYSSVSSAAFNIPRLGSLISMINCERGSATGGQHGMTIAEPSAGIIAGGYRRGAADSAIYSARRAGHDCRPRVCRGGGGATRPAAAILSL